MKIDNKMVNSTMYVGLNGELDEHAAEYARKNLDALFAAPEVKRIVIDLSELSFMDSTGIGVLIGRFKKMRARQVPIFIANPSRPVDKIFMLTGIYDIMPKIV